MSGRTRSPWGLDKVYLALSINGAIYTVNALRPTNRNKVLFAWSFFASWITIELAWFHLLVQLVATGAFWRRGAFRRPAGKLGLVIWLASTAGLLYTVRQSLAAKRQISELLKDIPEESFEDDKVVVERNVPYVPGGGPKLRLDIYRPKLPAIDGKPRPVLFYIHGGGWVIGDKREQGLPMMRHLSARGWVCVTVNYRLSPKVAFPTHLEDVKRALAWTRQHVAEYGGDPGFIAVSGGSAGGHLAALVALTQNDPEYQPGFEDADTSVQAAVPIYGVYDFTNRNGAWPADVLPTFIEPMVMKKKLADDPEAFAKASPLDQVGPDAPPMLVVHGSIDTLAPVADARDLVRRLQDTSEQPVYYLELEGTQHAFDIFPSIRSRSVIAGIHRFLTGVHRAYLEAGDQAPADVVAPPEVVEEKVGERLETDALDASPDDPVPADAS